MRFFYLAISHDLSFSLWADLEHYIDPSARLLMSLEVAKDTHHETKGQHYHIACDMNDKQYDAFKKTIIIKKHNLKGQARDGVGRQYGCIPVSKVRDETKFLQYTCKDQNVRFRGFENDEIKKFIEESFPKVDRKSDLEMLMAAMILNHHTYYLIVQLTGLQEFNTQLCEEFIISYFMDNVAKQKVLNKSSIRSFVTRYIMYHAPQRELLKTRLYYYLMHN